MTKIRKMQGTLLAVALGTLLPIGAAHAFDVLGNKISDAMPGDTAPAFDSTRYNRLEVLGNTAWMPKQGAEGPVRDETMASNMESSQKYERREVLGNIILLPQNP